MAVELREVTLEATYRRVLEGASARLAPGRVHAITGRVGCGKSVLMGCLAGLLAPRAGEVRCLGLPASSRELVRRTGLLLEQEEPYPRETVRRYLSRHAERLGLAWRPLRDAARDLVGALAPYAIWPRSLRHLSYGERRAAAIVRALLGSPDLILLDEPLACLDPAARRHLTAVLCERAAAGATVVVATHCPEPLEAAGATLWRLESDRLEPVRSGGAPGPEAAP